MGFIQNWLDKRAAAKQQAEAEQAKRQQEATRINNVIKEFETNLDQLRYGKALILINDVPERYRKALYEWLLLVLCREGDLGQARTIASLAGRTLNYDEISRIAANKMTKSHENLLTPVIEHLKTF